MINQVLSHLVAITCNRDHRLLDLSVLSALCEISGASRARVLDLFHEGGAPRVRERAAIIDGQALPPVSAGLGGEDSEDLLHYPALCEALQNQLEIASQPSAEGHTSWILIWQEDKVGNCLEIHTARPIGEENFAMVRGVLAVHRNFQALLEDSERDSLTGLLNRKTFDERYTRMLGPATLSPLPHAPERRHPANAVHCLGVIDIDHFKRVNDRFGHLYGDEVLILVSNLLRSSFRAQDQVFRFGGEEFVVLVNAASQEDARAAFERFRQRVEQHLFPQVGQVTVSIGFSIMDEQPPVQVLGQADSALYHAKQNGRNVVCQYEELVAQGLIAAPVVPESVEVLFD